MQAGPRKVGPAEEAFAGCRRTSKKVYLGVDYRANWRVRRGCLVEVGGTTPRRIATKWKTALEGFCSDYKGHMGAHCLEVVECWEQYQGWKEKAGESQWRRWKGGRRFGERWI